MKQFKVGDRVKAKGYGNMGAGKVFSPSGDDNCVKGVITWQHQSLGILHLKLDSGREVYFLTSQCVRLVKVNKK